jgi:hypothetical protein
MIQRNRLVWPEESRPDPPRHPFEGRHNAARLKRPTSWIFVTLGCRSSYLIPSVYRLARVRRVLLLPPPLYVIVPEHVALPVRKRGHGKFVFEIIGQLPDTLISTLRCHGRCAIDDRMLGGERKPLAGKGSVALDTPSLIACAAI